MEKIIPTLKAEPQPGQFSKEVVKCRFTQEEFVGKTPAQMNDVIKASYPEYNKEVALAYIDGASIAAMQFGMEAEALSHYIGRWAMNDEYMLVASLYATARNHEEQAGSSLILTPTLVQ